VKTVFNLKKMIGFGIVLFMLASLFACQTPAGRTPGQVVDDSTMTTKVKALFFEDREVKGLAISVKTFEGEVTLTGAVNNDRQRKRAEEIAYSVTGVRKVNNLLSVRGS